MNDKEFVLEALKRLIPDTSWWGESNHDSESVKNLDLLSNMIDMMVEILAEYSYVPEGNKGNGNKTLCAVLMVVGIWEMSNVCWALSLIN